MSTATRLPQELRIINIGLASFKDAFDHVGAAAVQVAWNLPLDIDEAALTISSYPRNDIGCANHQATMSPVIYTHPQAGTVLRSTLAVSALIAAICQVAKCQGGRV